MTFPWTDDIKAYVIVLTEPVDCIVLGRNLAEGVHPALDGTARGRGPIVCVMIYWFLPGRPFLSPGPGGSAFLTCYLGGGSVR